MYEIGKRFTFSASHRLTHLPEEHKCHRLHGHNYVVEIALRSVDLDERGFVIDYAELGVFGEWIDKHLDHQHLNDAMSDIIDSVAGESGLSNLDAHERARATTAESLARLLFGVARYDLDLTHVCSVTVRETEKTWATYGL